MLNQADFRYTEPLRVRWAEVDLQRIVFNGHYLMYFDTAVAGWWRAMALPYHDSMVALSGDLFVRKATLEYERSARYDERLAIGIRCGRLGNSSLRVDAAAFRDGQRLVTGELVYVFADPATQTSRPLPQPLRNALAAFEAGEAMTTLEQGGWERLAPESRALRHAVFVGEFGASGAAVEDAQDAGAAHVLLRNRLGLAVACGRLVDEGGGVGRIGRLACHAGVRGAGLGVQVLDALLAAARGQGLRTLRLTAGEHALGLYLRRGFVADGEAQDEAGVPHRPMRLDLG